jgi:enoyl-[acyl-carrier protein] reductase I
MSFLKLEGKNFFIQGVANKKSVAYFVAQTIIAEGGSCLFSVQKEDQVEVIKKLFPGSSVVVCDVEKKEDITKLPSLIKVPLHGYLHSLAFADFSEGVKPFHETKREHYLQAAQISAFSFTEVSNALKDLLVEGASVATISISSTRATSYGYLGPIKAMLEASVPFLAKSLSPKKIRVNAIGAGPLKTSASAGIPDYIDNYLYSEELTLRKENLRTQEVADTAAFLLSERSSGINATTIIVDAGMSANYFDQTIVKGFIKNGPSKP